MGDERAPVHRPCDGWEIPRPGKRIVLLLRNSSRESAKIR